MDKAKTTFTDLGLNPQILKALNDVGYTHPTPIQEEAIPYVLMGRDVVGIAQTGTGKTAGFVLPLVEILQTGRAKPRMPRALVLAPTRELAAQIMDNLNNYSKHTTLKAALVVGGDPMPAQTAQLQRGVDILVATPGRLLDHVLRSGLILTDVKFFVIDEADRMLDMGFIPDIEKIVKMLPKLRQTLMFTATMPPVIRKLTTQFLQNPKEISVSRASSTGQNITQNLYHTTNGKKADVLARLINDLQPASAIVFCNRKLDVDKVKSFLQKKGLSVAALHGDMVQAKRYENLEQFKSGQTRILVCSDVAARGIDIDDIAYVFNYDLPHNSEDYVHRIGRTGRAGKQGHAITLVTDDDAKNLDAVKKLIQRDIPYFEGSTPLVPAPSAKPDIKKQPAKAGTKPASQPQARPPQPAKPAPVSHEKKSDQQSKGFGDDLPDFMKPGK